LRLLRVELDVHARARYSSHPFEGFRSAGGVFPRPGDAAGRPAEQNRPECGPFFGGTPRCSSGTQSS
jgi:hypothetical protein